MNTQLEEIIGTQTASKIKRPPLYKVIFFNDDFTPFQFVELLLQVIFSKTEEQAKQIAYQIHTDGKAIVACYTKEIAQTKQQQTQNNCRRNGYPLLCEIEPVEE